MKIQYGITLVIKGLSTILGLIGVIGDANCQQGLPDSIKVQYYQGGDYHERNMQGVIEDFYDLTFDFNSVEKRYQCQALLHRHQVYDRKKRGTKDYRLVSDSTILIYDELILDTTQVIELIRHLDRNMYIERRLVDTISLEASDFFLDVNTALIIADLEAADYGIDTVSFHEICSYYRKKIVRNTDSCFADFPDCEENVDYTELLTKLIEAGHTKVVVSSYTNWISVLLYYADGDIEEVLQQYPGGINTGWDVNFNDKTLFRVVNPRINRIISSFMHDRYSPIRHLLEFEDEEQLVFFYLTSKK